ncbi:TetR/AcrR family transcriptional regulator [Qipengyuania qiaonensis]|uniref:TetR/AcrR family transcriptional regulator n=1 Tax=Qipengyuania qiaonensis TaxID=2867240 RepID=A0ABS7J6J2_9SPHN|nr:TetR/AcrR family transcriptional regulator [Qipengyuania qiaonensis]MBX7481699.1 TetR/AcrR family transcriptional regulator [Qipengyuania qiaonensis]
MRKADPDNTELRKRQILDAALACFRAKGFAGASIGDICKAAGMSPGHLYHYFGSKDEIVTAIASQDRAQATATLQALGENGPLAEAILNALDPEFELGDYGIDGSLAFDVFAEASRNPAVAQSVSSLYRNVNAGLAALIRREQASGRIPAEIDPEGTALAITALVEGIGVMGISHDENELAAAAPAVRRAIQAILGLEPTADGDARKPLRTRRATVRTNTG